MSAHGLEPPDLIDVREGDAVHLVGAVCLEERAQALDTLAGRADVGEDERDHVLLAYAAALFVHIVRLTFFAPGLCELDQGVGTKHALV